MNKKERNLQQARGSAEQRLRIACGKVKDRCPSVKSICIDYKIYEDNENVLENEDSRKWDALSDQRNEAYAYDTFNINCYCYGGHKLGYDVSSVVFDAVREKKTVTGGEMVCRKSLRDVGNYSCLRTFKYEINIEYKIDDQEENS